MSCENGLGPGFCEPLQQNPLNVDDMIHYRFLPDKISVIFPLKQNKTGKILQPSLGNAAHRAT